MNFTLKILSENLFGKRNAFFIIQILMYVNALIYNHKITYIFDTNIFWNCISSSVYVCMKDTYRKFSIYYKFKY